VPGFAGLLRVPGVTGIALPWETPSRGSRR
jgi:hypothetical protein